MTPRGGLISVVVPTKNRHALLIRALASALRQRDATFEMLVVDDGVGAAAAVAGAFPGAPNIACLDNRGRGQVPARNYGAREAHGEIVAFLDDDDEWGRDDYLARVGAALAGKPAWAYASGAIVYNEDGARLPFRARASAQTMRADNTVLVSGFAYARSLHARLGAFDETLPYYWDWDWYLRLIEAGVPGVDLGDLEVLVYASHDTVSSRRYVAERERNLKRLATKHGLGELRLRNHASIAEEEAAAAPPDRPAQRPRRRRASERTAETKR